MTFTNLQRDRGKLWNQVNKIKYPQKLSNSLGMLLPLSWQKTLHITPTTPTIMTLDLSNNAIIIKLITNPDEYDIVDKGGKREEVSSPIPS